MKIEKISTEKLIPYARNARKHDAEQVSKVAASIREFGFNNPVLIDASDGIIAGHCRVLAAQKLALPEVPCIRLGHLTKTQKRAYILADNRLAEIGGGWDAEMLKLEIEDLINAGINIDELIGFREQDLDDMFIDTSEGEGSGKLFQKFLLPPFSVLDARSGEWQERKKAWLALGIDSGEGRAEELTFNTSGRGIVASRLGRQYVGIDLRPEQVEENRLQAAQLCPSHLPTWIVGDSLQTAILAPDVAADFVMSCPPYADLEQYSDDARDLSNMPYEQFWSTYAAIIRSACKLLKPDRFAAFVVGEVRDAKGLYHGFVPNTIRAFEEAGLSFYNEAILATQTAPTALRVGRQFSGSRKLGKTHQNVLVFVKGDPKLATQACGPVEIFDPESESAETINQQETALALKGHHPAPLPFRKGLSGRFRRRMRLLHIAPREVVGVQNLHFAIGRKPAAPFDSNAGNHTAEHPPFEKNVRKNRTRKSCQRAPDVVAQKAREGWTIERK